MNERPYPSTEMIVSALRVLGVQGPASAIDVLNAAGLDLPERQLPEVLSKIAQATTDRPTGTPEPVE